MRIVTLAAALLAAWLAAAPAAAGEVQVESARDLEAVAAVATERDVPVLLMFSSPFCSYCQLVEEDFLEPMLLSGDYTDKVVIRKVGMTIGERKLTGFHGEPITVDELASRYDVSLTPTLVFVDSEGHALAKNLVGVTTVDYYGYYVDESIDVALGRLRRVESSVAEASD